MNNSMLHILFLYCFQSVFITKYEKDICLILYNDKNNKISKGYIHILSNDLIVNDISLEEWAKEEKRGLNKISNTGYTKISKSLIKCNNKIELDSINIVYRCDKGFGVQYKIPINQDTIEIHNVKDCK